MCLPLFLQCIDEMCVLFMRLITAVFYFLLVLHHYFFLLIFLSMLYITQIELSSRLGNIENSFNMLSNIPSQSYGKEKDAQYYNNTVSLYIKQKKYHAASLLSLKAINILKAIDINNSLVKEEIIRNDHNGNDNNDENKNNSNNNSNDTSNDTTTNNSKNNTDNISNIGFIPLGLLPHRCAVSVIYSTAISLLMSGNPLGAFSYFESITTQMGKNTILWIRMAECCVQYHIKEEQKNGMKSTEVLSVVGSSRSRRLFVNSIADLQKENTDNTSENNENNNNNINNNDDTLQGSSSCSNSCTMQHAVRYLTNALYLIRAVHNKTERFTSIIPFKNEKSLYSDISFENNLKSLPSSSTSSTTTTPPSTPTTPTTYSTPTPPTSSTINSTNTQHRIDILESSVLLKTAYAHLVLNNSLCALSSAQEVLSSPRLISAGKQTK